MPLSISNFIVADLLRSLKDRGARPTAPGNGKRHSWRASDPTSGRRVHENWCERWKRLDVIRQKGSHMTLHNPETDKTTLVAMQV
jgi:hypothetical protein